MWINQQNLSAQITNVSFMQLYSKKNSLIFLLKSHILDALRKCKLNLTAHAHYDFVYILEL